VTPPDGRQLAGSPALRLTVIGTGTAAPEAGTAASGVLVQSGATAVLFDCGSGIASRLEDSIGAENLNAVVIGHQHADHWIDLAPMRYRFLWGGRSIPRLPVFLPPGGTERIQPLAFAIAERPTFFHDAYELHEYVPGEPIQVGQITIRPVAAQHYVPAWSMDITGPGGARIVYGGDMGPTETIVELGREADLLLLEATLVTSVGDDPRRGHLTPEEAIDIAIRSGARQTLLVHYLTERRGEIAAMCAASGAAVTPALPGTIVEIGD
jgi:ribonuclease BN (tRNA processing enzyme)